jgi:hypothetical protein
MPDAIERKVRLSNGVVLEFSALAGGVYVRSLERGKLKAGASLNYPEIDDAFEAEFAPILRALNITWEG